jgi:ankyrin repeat protein
MTPNLMTPKEATRELFQAAEAGKVRDAAVAIEAGGNLNAMNEDGSAPLHLAAAHGYTTLVRLLIEKGASVIATNGAGQTPRELADANGHTDLATKLSELEKGGLVGMLAFQRWGSADTRGR